MDQTQDSVLKEMALATARHLAGSEGRQAVLLMQRLGLFGDGTGRETPPEEEKPTAHRIGIWAAKMEDGALSFERSSERSYDWNLWADIPRIPPKGTRKRVVLLGESVARGYFYDPQFTPARVLHDLLERADIPGGVEIVDLAKNDLLADELSELLRASLMLAPEAFVIFAGNNWARAPVALPDGIDRHLTATILRERGVAGLKAHIEANLSALVESRVREALGPLSQHIPIILLVPEFNLGDWRLDGEADAPWLAGDRNERWWRCLQEAREHLSAGRIGEAEALAREVVELDGGTASSGLSLLAECCRLRGRWQEARELLEKARDAHSWDTTPQVPKALSVIQAGLRGGSGGVSVIDLPRLFAEHLGGELPDRRLFLDYCHLTSDGIRLAMGAAAERLAPLLGARGPAAGEPLAAIAPDPEVEAEARIAAAIHCAHWGQPYDIVRHHCDKAIEASPKAKDAMFYYLDLQVRAAPGWVCESAERMAELGIRSLRRYVLTYNQQKLFDEVLLNAIADALEAAGTPARAHLEQLRAQEQGLSADRSIDLLDPLHRTSYADRNWLWWPGQYYRACSPVSRFPLVCDSAQPVALRLTCRRPGGKGPDGGSVWINGALLQELPATAVWKTYDLQVPGGLLREGVNTVEIRWPLELNRGDEEIDRVALTLEQGLPYQLLPVFGEIHSFRASRA